MNLITNRTQADVDRVRELAAKAKAGTWSAQEQAEWLAGMRGAYNYTDWNRVEAAVAELATMLGVQVSTVTTWGARAIPTVADSARYLSNIRKLRTVCQGLTNTPATPESMQRMTFRTANDIEKILTDLETVAYGELIAFNLLYGGAAHMSQVLDELGIVLPFLATAALHIAI